MTNSGTKENLWRWINENIYESYINMEHKKYPGKDGLTKGFWCMFWNEIKIFS